MYLILKVDIDKNVCETVEIPEAQVSASSAPHTNGIIFAFEDITGFGCYSALGRAPGFIGRGADAGKISNYN